MIKRLLSILFLSSLVGISCAQTQGAFWRFASSFKVPTFVSLAAANVAGLVAFASLYNQKNDDLKTYNIMKTELEKPFSGKEENLFKVLLDRGCTNKAELEWAMDYDAALRFDLRQDSAKLIGEFKTSVAKLKKVTLTPEVESLINLYSSLISAFETVSIKNDEPISQAELMPQFKPTIQYHLFDIRQQLKKPALSKQRKDQLERRRNIMINLMKCISIYDFARSLPQKHTEKLKELDAKITETPKARDRLWMFPVAINGLIAMACGIHYLMSPK